MNEPKENQAKHSPLPWGKEESDDVLWIGPMRSDGSKIKELVLTIDCDGGYKPEVLEKIKANAELILTAVNSHAHLVESNRRLVEACESAIPHLEAYRRDEFSQELLSRAKISIDLINDAIAFAKGQP